MLSSDAALIIQKGEPHSIDKELILSLDKTVLGRTTQNYVPNISFANPYISRKHALIIRSGNEFFITDLSSKHGTIVNGMELKPNQPYALQNGDNIKLAQGAVGLLFRNGNDLDIDTTVDLIQYSHSISRPSSKSLLIDPDRREVLVNGEAVLFSGKELALLLELYRNCNKAVSYDLIRQKVWPERSSATCNNVPEVGSDEISALVYRLRRRLGEYGELIVTVPRYGYRLDL